MIQALTQTKNGTVTHHYRWLHDVTLNNCHLDLRVNVLHDAEMKSSRP